MAEAPDCVAGAANAAGAIAVPSVVIATAPMTAGAMNDLILKVSPCGTGLRHGLSTQRGAVETWFGGELSGRIGQRIEDVVRSIKLEMADYD